MPTLNKIRDQVRELIREKNFPLNTMRALWRISIEAAEAGDIYLKTGCQGYWNKQTHKPVTQAEYDILTQTAYGVPKDSGGRPLVVLAVDAFLEELIDTVFFIVNSTHEVAPNADLDKVFRDKLAYNFTRPKQYGVSEQVKNEFKSSITVEDAVEAVRKAGGAKRMEVPMVHPEIVKAVRLGFTDRKTGKLTSYRSKDRLFTTGD